MAIFALIFCDMQLKPLHDNVIVKALSEEKKTATGIILPDTVDKERPEQGEVIAVGPGKLLENGNRSVMSVQVGDRVVFKKYSPDEVKIKNEEYLVVNESEIIATLEQGDNFSSVGTQTKQNF